MSAPGGAPSMGGMSPPSGEISEQVAKMMGSSKGGATGGVTNGVPGSGQMSAAQAAQLQNQTSQATQPREVGTLKDELKLGFSDILQGIKEFFSMNTWLGINPNKLDPQQQALAKQLHARYQQLDQEQQAVARHMYEEKMQKKRMQQEEEQRKKQIEAQKQAQSFEMPSSPKKGAVGPGGGKSKKQNMLTKLKQDRTTLNNTQGE